ncbi:MAG: GNAT family N-acetyltransferase [bacterium]
MPAEYNVRSLEPGDVAPAAEFMAARQCLLRETVPMLPARFERPEVCADVIRETMGFADGFAAERDGNLVGFLQAIKNLPDPTSGGARYSPERGSMMLAHGHSVAPGEPQYPVYNALFAALADQYRERGIFDHIAHVPCGDPELLEAWANLGFGRSTAFAARDTSRIVTATSADTRQATPADLEEVYRIACSGSAYHSEPPIFNPYLERQAEEDVRAQLRKGLADEAEAMFLGFVGGRPAGLLWIHAPFGSPVLVPDDACYIGDTAVLPEARGSGVGSACLQAALTWARSRDYKNVVLHFSTANPLSTAFWTGHGFEPLMYQVRRHIDERVAWARPEFEITR